MKSHNLEIEKNYDFEKEDTFLDGSISSTSEAKDSLDINEDSKDTLGSDFVWTDVKEFFKSENTTSSKLEVPENKFKVELIMPVDEIVQAIYSNSNMTAPSKKIKPIVSILI